MSQDDDDDNLPVVRDQERVERLKEMHEKLERGDADEILVPIEAHDVGDTDVRENPRACDLGYSSPSGREGAVNDSSRSASREVEGGGDVAVASNLGGSDRIMYDPDAEQSSETKIECDADTFIDDVADWA